MKFDEYLYIATGSILGLFSDPSCDGDRVYSPISFLLQSYRYHVMFSINFTFVLNKVRLTKSFEVVCFGDTNVSHLGFEAKLCL